MCKKSIEPTIVNFLETLFDRGEHACIAQDVYGTTSYAVYDLPGTFSAFRIPSTIVKRLVTINPICVGQTRSDKNVARFRSFLIECDSGTLQSQIANIQNSGLPYSTCVFSGNKSGHFVISLENALPNRNSYDCMIRRIFKALKVCGVEVDQSCKNPSRSTRWPDGVRENGRVQKLIEVVGRIPNHEIEKWLVAKGAESESPRNYSRSRLCSLGKGHLSGWTLNYIMFGSELGHRNADLFRAACDHAAGGFSEDETFDQLFAISGLDEAEVKRTIASAFRKVSESD